MSDVLQARPSARVGKLLRSEVRRRHNSIWHALGRRPVTLVGLSLFGLLVLAVAGAPLLTSYDPIALEPRETLQPPNWQHPMGTDRFGRDQFSRILYGGRISLGVGVTSVGVAALLGVPLGLIAGYWTGLPDRIISRCTDVLMAFPTFLLALTIVFVLGPSLPNVMVAIGVSSSPTYIRLVRGNVLQLRETLFVEAACAVGCTDLYILRRHILPNTLSSIIIVSTLGLGGAILSAGALSFLGAGVQPPTAEWGAMLNEGRLLIRVAPWLTTFPGAGILLAVVAINLIGDGLRDILDPRLT
jgi:peptide/nickel transport system permease protein